MKITKLIIYPIKSLQGVSLSSAFTCAQGLQYDRRYILLKPRDNGTYENMFVGQKPEMALFHCSLTSESTSMSTLTVEYRTSSPPVTSPHPTQQTTVEIPLEPKLENPKRVSCLMHGDKDYPAYAMPEEYSKWFSECFGYQVILAYLGDGLGIPSSGEKAEKWTDNLKPIVPYPSSSINFSDGGALLVTSASSLEDLHPRLSDGEKVIHEKFRPNIIVDGEEGKPWDEDFWAELRLARNGLRIVLTAQCARCISINVDLEKGKMGEGESGKLLKKMMRDRRVDQGRRWEPVFGRYGFPVSSGELRVGDEIEVSRRNTTQDVWDGLVPRLTHLDQVVAA